MKKVETPKVINTVIRGGLVYHECPVCHIIGNEKAVIVAGFCHNPRKVPHEEGLKVKIV